jgi:hypothetical protein
MVSPSFAVAVAGVAVRSCVCVASPLTRSSALVNTRTHACAAASARQPRGCWRGTAHTVRAQTAATRRGSWRPPVRLLLPVHLPPSAGPVLLSHPFAPRGPYDTLPPALRRHVSRPRLPQPIKGRRPCGAASIRGSRCGAACAVSGNHAARPQQPGVCARVCGGLGGARAAAAPAHQQRGALPHGRWARGRLPGLAGNARRGATGQGGRTRWGGLGSGKQRNTTAAVAAGACPPFLRRDALLRRPST